MNENVLILCTPLLVGSECLIMAAAFAHTVNASALNIHSAIGSTMRCISSLQAWLAVITAVKYTDYYSEQFKMYLADPSSTHVFDKIFEEHKLIAVTLALCQKVGLLSLERNTPLFPRCKFPFDKKRDASRFRG